MKLSEEEIQRAWGGGMCLSGEQGAVRFVHVCEKKYSCVELHI